MLTHKLSKTMYSVYGKKDMAFKPVVEVQLINSLSV